MPRKIDIELIKKEATERGWQCTSNAYAPKSFLSFKCDRGCKFEKTYQNFKHSKGCPKCSSKRRMAFQEVRDLFNKHNWTLLNKSYDKSNIKLQALCPNSHKTKISLAEFKTHVVRFGKSNCKKCSSHNINDVKKIFREYGWRLISSKYEGNKSVLNAICPNDHKTKLSYGDFLHYHVKKGKPMCKKCSRQEHITIKQCKELAKKRGGKCLEDEVTGNQTKVKWECQIGHAWEANYNSIQRGGWCPYCQKSWSEEICREVFESIYKKPFLKQKPKWLKIGKRQLLELDGYNKELNIAFEHQGIQHYKSIEFYTGENSNIFKQKHYDEIKWAKCKENRVSLVCIPPVFEVIKLSEIKKYIFSELVNLGINPNINIDEVNVNFDNAYKIKNFSKSKIISEYKASNMLAICKKYKLSPNTMKQILHLEGVKIKSISEARGGITSNDDIKKVISLYKSGTSGVKISEIYNVTPTSIYNLLKKEKVKRRTNVESHGGIIDKKKIAEIIYDYKIHKSTISQIAKKLNVSVIPIRRILKENGVRIRTSSETQGGITEEKSIESVMVEYKKGSSTLELASMHGTTTTTIRNLLKRNGVKTRSHKEAQMLYLKKKKTLKNSRD